ncbi:cytochrome P450 [Amylostereum chailletii]|nr:cytochrome P450 [Amylostereum chailletii]
MLSQILLALITLALLSSAKPILRLVQIAIHPYFSRLRDVPGPVSPSFVWGCIKEFLHSDPGVPEEKWTEQYGPVFKMKAFLNAENLVTSDTKALAYIFGHPVDYQKPEPIRESLGKAVGPGLLVVEEDAHKQQRRIMSPAFGIPQIRELTTIFLEKSIQLRDIWKQQVRPSNEDPEKEEPIRVHKVIDAVDWLNKTTLDIIGLAGFNYSFDALNPTGKPNELNEAVKQVFFFHEPSVFEIIQEIFPFTRIIQTKSGRALKTSRRTMARIGRQLLADMKEAVRAASSGDAKVERKDFQRKDLLSLLVKANMATDLPESGRMSDEDVLAQVPTFLIAGHETTSSAVTWILFALAKYHDIQDKLRTELLQAPDGDMPTMEALNALPYLDAVVREAMRVHAPVANTIRVAMHDDVIPTDKEWVDTKGVRRRGIPVSKGDTIYMPILLMNKSKEIWGEDAHEFKPERWQNPPEAATSIAGVWSNILTFSGGPRACIGYRFSIIETKAIVYTLVRTFRFELAFDFKDLKPKGGLTTRPYIASKMEEGAQLPLKVSLVDG